jgi:hypothetical protein
MIRTVMRAVALDDAAARARGSSWEATGAEELEGPYEPLSAAVVLCARRYFRLGQDVRDLHRYVAAFTRELAAYPDAPPFPPREAEAVLRSALDEHYLLTEVDPVRRVAVESLLLAELARDLRPTAEQIDAWASEAEAAAERLLLHGTRFGGGRWEVLIPSEEREAANAAPLRRYELIKSPHPPVPRFRARQPQTLPGRYARAVVRGDRAARDRLSPQLDNVQTGTALRIVADMLRGMLRPMFPPGTDLRVLTASIGQLRHQLDGGRLPLLEVDALVRELLDEPAFTDGIGLVVRYGTWGGLAMGIAQLGKYTDREVDHMAGEAEATVTDQVR